MPPPARSRRRRLGVLLLLTGVASCAGGEGQELARPLIDTMPGGIPRTMSPGPTGWLGESGWRVELAREFTGEPETPSELLNPQSLALDEWDRVFVVDQQPSVIKVYDPDGRLIRTVGGQGEGPGEFRAGFVALHGDALVLHDPRVGRTSVWDTSGAFRRSWPSACCAWGDIAVDRQGRIVIPTTGRGYLRYTLDGALVDTLEVPMNTPAMRLWTVSTVVNGQPLGRLVAPVPLTPRTIQGFNPEGGLLVGWSADYQIAVAPRGVDTSAVFGRTWTPMLVDGAVKRRLVDRMVADHVGDDITEELLRRSFPEGEIPDRAPAFTAMHADGRGNRWIRLEPGADTAQAVFDIFTPEGVYLGATSIRPAPPDFTRLAFSRDGVAIVRENAAGVPAVLRFRVVRPAGAD